MEALIFHPDKVFILIESGRENFDESGHVTYSAEIEKQLILKVLDEEQKTKYLEYFEQYKEKPEKARAYIISEAKNVFRNNFELDQMLKLVNNEGTEQSKGNKTADCKEKELNGLVVFASLLNLVLDKQVNAKLLFHTLYFRCCIKPGGSPGGITRIDCLMNFLFTDKYHYLPIYDLEKGVLIAGIFALVFENSVLFCGPEINSCDNFVSRNLEQIKFQCWNSISDFLQKNNSISNVYFTTQNVGLSYLFSTNNDQKTKIKKLNNQSSLQNWNSAYLYLSNLPEVSLLSKSVSFIDSQTLLPENYKSFPETNSHLLCLQQINKNNIKELLKQSFYDLSNRRGGKNGKCDANEMHNIILSKEKRFIKGLISFCFSKNSNQRLPDQKNNNSICNAKNNRLKSAPNRLVLPPKTLTKKQQWERMFKINLKPTTVAGNVCKTI